MKFNFEHLKQVQQQLAEMYDQEDAYGSGDLIHSITLTPSFDGKQWHANVHMQIQQFTEVVNRSTDRVVEVSHIEGHTTALHLSTEHDGVCCVTCIYVYEMHNRFKDAGLEYDDLDLEELLKLWAYHNKWNLREDKYHD